MQQECKFCGTVFEKRDKGCNHSVKKGGHIKTKKNSNLLFCNNECSRRYYKIYNLGYGQGYRNGKNETNKS